MKRNLYLETTPVEEARDIYMSRLSRTVELKYENIPAEASYGRVTAEAVYAACSSPLFNAAAMDGIAVRAEDTAGASEVYPLCLKEDQYLPIDTGDPVRAPFDAVIMAEDILETEEGVRISASAAPWQHVRPVGEDIVAGEMILPGRHCIRAIDVGVLLSAGVTEVKVIRKPRVAIFPTGTEMIEAGETPLEGSVIESNSRMFENMVGEAGGIGIRHRAIPDDRELLRREISEAADDYDLVIINAGSSAGTEDYTVHVLRELGEVIIHGVAIKPGKPVILATVKGKPVIGLPGYPVSAYIGFENFAAPVIEMMSGAAGKRRQHISAVLSRRVVSSLKHKEYVRVKVGKVDGRFTAAPLARGAGAAMSLVRCDGFCVIEQNSEGCEAGETVEVELFRDTEEIENTAVIVGSHDLILDVIADMMPGFRAGMNLSSTHVGSMGGLMALKRGEAHMAPVHLLDAETGEYNVSYITRLLSEPMALIKGVGRLQGIMVKKGNPLGLHDISGLADGKIRYVNRQRGAGTRVLFDYLLAGEGISPVDVRGYEREMATHMTVAAAVASDSADAGMGILSAARAMDLDFIPVADEEYDFAVPRRFLELPQVETFIAVLKSDAFRRKTEELGGYSTMRTGEIVYL